MTKSQIAQYTTMKMGGEVEEIFFIESHSQLRQILGTLHQAQRHYVVIGGGSNVVFPDCAPRLSVIIMRTSNIRQNKSNIEVDAGVTNASLLNWCVSHQRGGLEFLAGIPGTIGGAAAVNAGAFGKSISQWIESARIIDPPKEEINIPATEFQFTYRNSRFKYGSNIILSIRLRTQQRPSEEIRSEINHHLNYRKQNHPSFALPTAGCFFKNPELDGRRTSAGQLLDQSGLKGESYRGLALSSQHANFLVNGENANQNDLKEFERTIIKKVESQRGIQLEREVIYISPEGEKY